MSVLQELHKKRVVMDREWYSIRSLMGYDWAMFYFLLGGRSSEKRENLTQPQSSLLNSGASINVLSIGCA
jgi:hypothetical protein